MLWEGGWECVALICSWDTLAAHPMSVTWDLAMGLLLYAFKENDVGKSKDSEAGKSRRATLIRSRPARTMHFRQPQTISS